MRLIYKKMPTVLNVTTFLFCFPREARQNKSAIERGNRPEGWQLNADVMSLL